MRRMEKARQNWRAFLAEVEPGSVQGFGLQLDWTRRTALVDIDFVQPYTSQDTELGSDLHQPIAATHRLLESGCRQDSFSSGRFLQ